MPKPYDLYSKFICFLKVALPLAALCLMSTIVIFASSPLIDGTIVYAEVDHNVRASRMSKPQVSGLSQDGSVIELNSLFARLEGNVIIMETLTAAIDSADGTRIDIRAGTGEIDNIDQTVRLTGLARLVTSNGYEMKTTGLTANLNMSRIVSEGVIEVQAPYGELTAGQLIIEPPHGRESQRWVFQHGVRLVYIPQ